MSIKLRAIHQAVALLSASGAQFAIEFEGKTFGNAALAKAETKADRKRQPKSYSWVDLYLPFLKTCKPGDVFSHGCATKDEAESLRGSISSRMAHEYGVGTYLCSVTKSGDKHVVDCLYVGATAPVEPETA